MRTRYLTLLGVAVLLIAAGAFLTTSGSTPKGQPPLAELNNLSDFKAQFNRDLTSLRVIISVSPSCPYCLKGASAIERILARHPTQRLAVFVVWQSILPTDWSRPWTAPLHRLSDVRVRQFWDDDHLVAESIKRALGSEVEPACCVHKGIWWDFMAVFPPAAAWTDTLPAPLLIDGTVEEAAGAFEVLLNKW